MPQNYSSQKLKGRSFKGQNLTGADFSNADIQGVDFTNAVLIGANFSHARAGQQYRWIAGIVAISTFLAGLAGLLSAYAAGFVPFLMFLSPKSYDRQEIFWISGILAVIVLAVCGLIIVERGLGTALGVFATIVAVAVAFIAWAGKGDAFGEAIVALILQSVAIGIIMAGVILAALAITTALLIGGKLIISLVWIAALLMPIPGALEVIETEAMAPIYKWIVLSIAGTITVISLGLSAYISFRVIAGDRKYFSISTLAITLSSLGGTRFRGADLTDADFTQATLKSADFRKATLKRTCWFKVQKLDRARLEGTYLEHPHLRQLAVTKDGSQQNYDRLDLQGFNLKDANLQNASFIGANLSRANLQKAIMLGTKLVQTQLYKANLTDAHLTGAYIQDWAISLDTQLEGVKCDYIFMRLPTKDDPDACRKPDNKNENFKEGDFSDFIAPIIKTLEIYRQQNVDPRQIASTFKSLDIFHYQGIDPSAAAIALKQLAEQHPEAGLKVVALEGRGEEKIRLQARVTGKSDRSRLSAEYFEKYQEITSLPYGDLQSLLAAMVEKDERIRSLENMVMTAMKSAKFYVETYYNFGDTSEEEKTVKKILILTANPQNIDKRRLDAEVREIQTGLERAKKRDQFAIISKWAVRPDDLRRALLDYEPQIVHFSGYGSATEGLALENELGKLQMVSTAALAKLFEVFQDKVECVLLNACYSETQAEAIRQHIDYVIGMHQAIGNRAAIEFAVGFYDALGAGRSIEDAFKLGRIAVDLQGIPESLTPVLKKKTDHK